MNTHLPNEVTYVHFEDKTVIDSSFKTYAELMLREITTSVVSLRSVVLEVI